MIFTCTVIEKAGTIMKKVLQTLCLAVVALPVISVANKPQTTTAPAVQKTTTTLISPRTGIRYTLSNTGDRPVVLKTTQIAPANAVTVNRIVATNPALSAASQEKAKQALLSEPAQLAAN